MATLPELVQAFYVKTSQYNGTANDPVTLVTANPLRWGLWIMSTELIAVNPFVTPAGPGNTPFPLAAVGGILRLNNRDEPGAPQQEWIMSATFQLTTIYIVEFLQTRSS